MTIKPFYIRFEGLDDDRPLMRHVSRTATKNSDTVRVIKVVAYDDVKPLLDSVSKLLKNNDSHNFEILKTRMSYWRDLILNIQDRIL